MFKQWTKKNTSFFCISTSCKKTSWDVLCFFSGDVMCLLNPEDCHIIDPSTSGSLPQAQKDRAPTKWARAHPRSTFQRILLQKSEPNPSFPSRFSLAKCASGRFFQPKSIVSDRNRSENLGGSPLRICSKKGHKVTWISGYLDQVPPWRFCSPGTSV